MYVKSSSKDHTEMKMHEALQPCPKENLQGCKRKSDSSLLWLSVAAMVVVTLAGALLLTARGWGRVDSEAASDALVCYYNAPSALLPRDIHPHLCTHINVGFAVIENKQVMLSEAQQQTLLEVVKLKRTNPDLKVLLSVGGAPSGTDGFPDMIINHESRKTFIKSVKYILRNYSLDGIDLDWEFPAVHDFVASKGNRQRQHFSQLLREIRNEFIREKRNYLLTVAVAAPQIIVDAAYDVDQLNLYVDFVNIMTYDFHTYTKFTPFTGFNSPLYARPSEQLYFATLNINYTVNMYLDKGLAKDKMVVGIPSYGHTFTLVNPNNPAVGSPASGFGSLGSGGFVDYPDICKFVKNFNDSVVINVDNDAKVPYLSRGSEWVSYDSPQSAMEKAKFIRENGLRGAMLYSLNADDYQGICTKGQGDEIKFPLAHAVKNSL